MWLRRIFTPALDLRNAFLGDPTDSAKETMRSRKQISQLGTIWIHKVNTQVASPHHGAGKLLVLTIMSFIAY